VILRRTPCGLIGITSVELFDRQHRVMKAGATIAISGRRPNPNATRSIKQCSDAWSKAPLDDALAPGSISSSIRLNLQDDFAKRPILNQMAQGFPRLAEGIDPLHDGLDGSAHDQRYDLPPRGSDGKRRLGK